jgi:succinate dehydrogenase / fumarate reductase cytochrome b subunit
VADALPRQNERRAASQLIHELLYFYDSTDNICPSRLIGIIHKTTLEPHMPELAAKKPRPIWYNLSPANLPAPGLLSILHRISGILLFLALVWMLYLLDLSLASEGGFEHVKSYTAHPIVKLALLVLSWAFLHHFCAGIRYLFLDMQKGIDLPAARATSFTVFAVSIILTLVAAVLIW